MAAVAGRFGRLYVGLASASATAEPVANLNNFSMTFSVDNYDVTAFGDTNKKYVAGLPDASGSYSGFYDTESSQLFTAAMDGAARKFYLYPDRAGYAGTYWFGTAFFDAALDEGVDGAVTISGDFQAATPVIRVTAA